MSLQSPLGRVLGKGSAKSGANHWLAQRLTAMGLIPLGLWFAFSVASLPHGDLASISLWIGQPFNAIALLLFVLTLSYHSLLGLQVIVEDYVHGAKGTLTLIAIRFVHAILVVAGVWAVLVVSLGHGGGAG